MIERPEELMHELRSPMSAILAHANALLDGWQGRPEDAERLAAIRIQAQHLLRFLGRPDQGAARRERIPPLAPAEEAVRVFTGSAAQRRLALACAGDGPLPEWIEVDATTVRLILANLIGNALKFTNEGGVRIAVSAAAGGIRYAVSDTGIGMDGAQLARLRADCVQVHASSVERGGQGFGLAAARRLAARAGGELAIDSLPGQGTCVSFGLPLACAGPPAPAGPARMLPEALLVHLDDVARLAIAAALKGSGYSVTATDDPADAVRRAALAHAAGRGFRVVFVASRDPGVLLGLADGAPRSRLVAVGDGVLQSPCQALVSSTPTRDELLVAIG